MKTDGSVTLKAADRRDMQDTGVHSSAGRMRVSQLHLVVVVIVILVVVIRLLIVVIVFIVIGVLQKVAELVHGSLSLLCIPVLNP